jgi:4-amino-4-deoxy-L-arabinose transferase-like glycosyltransferase
VTDRRLFFKGSVWPLVALLLIAFGLRVYQLDAQSLWSDEGLSLYRARLPLGEILSNVIVVPPGVPTRDTNPPLYFVEAGALRLAAGESEYALRFVSVLAGVLLVPLLYVTGKRLYSDRVGLVAALLGTLSPFLVWYSQEARAYTQIAALSLASVYLLLRALDLPRDPDPGRSDSTGRRWLFWMAWGAITLAMLASHFNAFLVLPFEGLIAVTAMFRSRRREALLVMGGLIVLAIPLFVYALARAQAMLDPVFRFRPLDSIAQETWSAFLVGAPHEIFQPVWAVLPGLILLVVGVLGGFLSKGWRQSAGIMLAYLLVPLLTFYVTMIVMPVYVGPRHIIFLLPPVYLLMAVGVAWLWARWRLIALGAMVVQGGLMIWWLTVQFTDSTYLKDDIRSAACAIAAEAQPDDIVVLNDAIGSFVFDYYYKRCGGAAPWTIIPVYPSLDFDDALSKFQVTAEAANRVWYVTHPERAGFDFQGIDEWARGHLLRLDHRTYRSLWLGSAYQLYTAHFPILDTLPSNAQPRALLWPSEQLQLAGVGPLALSPQRDQARVELYWRLDRPAQRNLSFNLRLVDSTGAEWGLWQGTAFDNWSARQWPVDQYIVQTANMALPRGLPAGEYALLVSIHDRRTNEVILPAAGSTEVEIMTVKVGAGKDGS